MNMTQNTNGIRHLNYEGFERAVLKSSTPTVVDFYADWCGPCKMVGPIIESLSNEYNGRVNFAKVDTDVEQLLAACYDIMSIPTVIVFKDGRIVEKIIGAVSAQVYRKSIDSALGAN
jgi:thioredoxin 1